MKLTLGLTGDHGTLATSVRQWLFMHAKGYRSMKQRLAPGMRYASTEELVLFCGTMTNANMNSMTLPDMEPGKCFANAFLVSQADRRYRYTEGWAMMERGFPTHHGWLTGPNGEIEDPTWVPLWKRYRDNERSSDTIWSGRAVYMGVTVDHEPHLRWTMERGQPNILSLGEMDIDAVRTKGLEAVNGCD